jgi:hypothetical protein
MAKWTQERRDAQAARWTPERRKAHGDIIRANWQRKRNGTSPYSLNLAPFALPGTVHHLQQSCVIFWQNLVRLYMGNPLGEFVTEELCVNVFKDSAKKAAEILKNNPAVKQM